MQSAHGIIFNAGEQRPSEDGVGQDKAGQRSGPTKLANAGPVAKMLRTGTHRIAADIFCQQTKQRVFSGRREKMGFWLKPATAAEIRRRAQQTGLSASATGAYFLDEMVLRDLQLQHGALLEPMVDKSIRKRMRFLAELLLLLLYDCSQMKYLLVNSLGRLPDYPVMSEDMFNHVRDESTRAAKRDLRSRSPHLKALIAEELEHFLQEGEA